MTVLRETEEHIDNIHENDTRFIHTYILIYYNKINDKYLYTYVCTYIDSYLHTEIYFHMYKAITYVGMITVGRA